MNKILRGGNKMFEFMMMKAMMEEVQEFLEEVIEDIKTGELEGLQARIVVDDLMERAYGTRKGILIDIDSKEGMTEEELAIIKETVNWAGEIITLCHVADELLGEVVLDFEEGQVPEDDGDSKCDNCDVRGLCEIFNKMDLFK